MEDTETLMDLKNRKKRVGEKKEYEKATRHRRSGPAQSGWVGRVLCEMCLWGTDLRKTDG